MEMNAPGSSGPCYPQTERLKVRVRQRRLSLGVDRSARRQQAAGQGQRRLQQGFAVRRGGEKKDERGRRPPPRRLPRLAAGVLPLPRAPAGAPAEQPPPHHPGALCPHPPPPPPP